jgi:predicted amidohydrolase YtcJ
MQTPCPLAEVIFSGGTVITMEDPVRPQASDVAIAEGRVLALLNRGQWAGLEGPGTRILDIQGKTLMPGLIDSHNHMTQFGQSLHSVDLSPRKISSMQELVDKIKASAEETPIGQWVNGWGYNEIYLREKKHPTREFLDLACPNHPVKIIRACMHVMAVNSLALNRAGISERTADPPGGKIGRDKNGQLNGLLYELRAMNLVNRTIPDPAAEDCAQFLGTAAQVYLREGLTLVTEAGAGFYGNPHEAAGFQLAWKSGKSKIRVSMGVMEKTYRLFPEEQGLGVFTGFGNEHLWVGPIKFVMDGSVSGGTAALSQPYKGSDHCGVLCEDVDSLTQRMERAHKAGFQISVHAIGDRAIEAVLNIYERILSRHPRNHRHRIEHAALCRPEFLPRMQNLGIVAVVQPAILHYFGDAYINHLGKDRLRYFFPLKSMLANGVVVAGSSDRPVADGNPWVGIWSAVHRVTVSGNSIHTEECLTPSQALQLYTSNAAYANHVEDRLGTLSPGKSADFLILDRNPLEIDPSELNNIKVLKTFINGKEVSNRENGLTLNPGNK